MDKDPVSGKLTPKASSERIYSFFASSYPVEPTDPFLRSTSGSRYYRELATGNGGGRIYDPWNSVYKDLPNTTNTVTANTPFKFAYVGPIEIRGLKANAAYCLTDVESGEKLTRLSDANGLIAFDTRFVNSVVYHVAEAQTGSLSGKVYDIAGNIRPGATIAIYDSQGKKVLWDTASDLDGFYSFPLVPEGRYNIVATFPKSYTTPASGTAAVPNNDTRYAGFTLVNLDYFDNVSKFTVNVNMAGLTITKDLVVTDDISINADYNIYLTAAPTVGGADFNPKFTINNLSASPKSFDVILAAYSGGKLVGINTASKVSMAGNSTIDVEPSIAKIEGADSYKFFIWEDYIPLAAITSID